MSAHALAAELKLGSAPNVKSINIKDRTVEHVISALAVDRDGDVLRPRGCQYELFLRKNPLVFLNHNTRELPVGVCLDIAVSDTEVVALTKFAGSAQLHEKAETVFRMYASGFLRSFSIGFVPLRVSREKLLPAQTGRSIIDYSLLEYSCVGIPSLPEAVVRMAKAFDLPDGATADDLAKALGTVPLRKFWDIATPILPLNHDQTADSVREEKEIPMRIELERAQAEAEAAEARAIAAEARVAALEGRVITREIAPSERRLLDGTPLGGDDNNKQSVRRIAPAFVRAAALGDRPYSVGRLALSLATSDKSVAPMEHDISEKLALAGYPTTGGALVPLGASELWAPAGHEQPMERLRADVKAAFAPGLRSSDPDELAALGRQIKAMDPSDATLGGSLMSFPMRGELITALRALAVVSRAGARQYSLPPSGSVHFPREAADPTFTWMGAAGTNTSISESNPITGGLTLAPARAAGLVKLPNDLLRYSQGTAEDMVRRMLILGAALTEDRAFLDGDGGSAAPLGISRYDRSANNTPTVNQVTLHNASTGTNGDTFLPEDVLKMMALVEEANDPVGATAWLMRPLMFSGLANLRADAVSGADGQGPFLFPITRGALGGAVEKELAGLPVFTSTQISKVRTKASGLGLTYVLTGNFSQAIVGRVGAVELAISKDAGFTADQTWLRAIIRVAFGLSHPESFCISDQLVIPS